MTPVYAPDPPAAPEGLRTTARDSQITLQWNLVQGADSYNVLRSSDGGKTYAQAALGVKGTSYTDSGLTDGVNLSYAVQSVNVGGTSANSTPLTAAPVAPIASPAELTALPGNAKVDLTWTSVTGATYYNVKRSTVPGGVYTIVASGLAATSYTDATASNGSMYEYVVTAANGQTESVNSAPVSAAPMNAPAGAPNAPDGLAAEAGENEITLTWNAVPGATAYIVKRGTTRIGPYTTLGSVSAPTYADRTAINGTTYYYTVSSVNVSGEGAATAPVIATPAHVIVVAKDGTGNFTSVQDALNSIASNNAVRTVIFMKNGVYYEKLNVNKPYVSLIGESRDGTVLSYDDYSCKQVPTTVVKNPTESASSCSGLPAGTNVLGTSLSYSVAVSAANVTVQNLTIQNTAYPRKIVAPAVALSVTGDKAVFRHVKVLGFQDTIYANSGRQYFNDAIVEGDVDYIFGNATAVFENSEMKFVGNAGGHTTAASTDQTSAYGYLFLNSKLTRGTSALKNSVTVGSWDSAWDIDSNLSATNSTVDLGRPWRAYANVKYINTWMDGHIKAAGWDNWGDSANELTASYGEYNSYGPGANPKGRSGWTRQLTANEANLYTPRNVLKGTDGWDPTQTGVFPSQLQPAKPTAPSGLKAALGDQATVSLTWNAVGGAQTYSIYRSSTAGGPYTSIATGIASNSYVDSTATAGAVYYYTATAVDETGESSASSEVKIGSTGAFDKNPASQTNLSVTVLDGDAVTGVTNGTNALTAGTNYTVNGNVVTINKSYLVQQPAGTVTLTIRLASGAQVPYNVTLTNSAQVPSQTIASVKPLHLYTTAGHEPFLPTIVPVTYTDQTTAAVSVAWDKAVPAQYAAPGTFTLQGTVKGTSIPAVATITVQAANAVAAVTGGPDLQSYLTNLPFAMPAITLYSYPAKDVNIEAYGAVGDGKTKNTSAFAQAIAAASAAGGGRVIVPAGVWLTGPITLKSNVDLHLETGSTILFSPDYSDYTPGATRYQSMLTGSGVSNVAITGNGTIDGNGQYWRYIKKSKMNAVQWNYLLSLGGVLSEDGSQWYPSQQAVNVGRPLMIDINTSTNVLIDGPTLVNSPQFSTSITLCQNVVIRNTTVNNDWWAQNGDGLDVTSSQNVLMYHNTVHAGDDAIGMKSSNDPNPANSLSQVVISDNIVLRGHGGLSMGSNTSGGIKNMAIRNNQYIGTDAGLNFKSYVGGGGPIENIYIDDIHMHDIIDTVIIFDSYYKGHDAASEGAQLGVDYRVPEFKNIHIRNVTADGAEQAVFIDALPFVPLRDLELNNVTIQSQKGWESHNTANVQLNNVRIDASSGTLYDLYNAKGFVFNQVTVPAGTGTFLHLGGVASGIQLINTELSNARTPYLLDTGIGQNVITVVNQGKVPAAPAQVSLTRSNAGVQLEWSTVTDATYYNIKRSTTSGSGYITVASNVTGTSFSDTLLNYATAYYYVVTAANNAGESGLSNEAAAAPLDPSEAIPIATLTGPDTIHPGQAFSLNYGLSQVSGSVYGAVYAQDLTFRFNPGQLTYISAETLHAGQAIVAVHTDVPGEVRVLLASRGADQGISSDGEVLKLNWQTAAEAVEGAPFTVTLTKATISDDKGKITALASAGYAGQVKEPAADKTALNAKIAEAQSKLDAASVGERWGQYPQAAWNVLRQALQESQAAASEANMAQSQVNQFTADLDEALQGFDGAVRTKASIGDLAVISSHYGFTSASPDWAVIKRYDTNQDNRLDIVDLTAIAQWILN